MFYQYYSFLINLCSCFLFCYIYPCFKYNINDPEKLRGKHLWLSVLKCTLCKKNMISTTLITKINQDNPIILRPIHSSSFQLVFIPALLPNKSFSITDLGLIL